MGAPVPPVGVHERGTLRSPEPPVSRPLLLGFVAVGALAAIGGPESVSSFAAGFAAGAGAVFLVSFLKNPRGPASEDQEPR